jgi:hypothetical protein
MRQMGDCGKIWDLFAHTWMSDALALALTAKIEHWQNSSLFALSDAFAELSAASVVENMIEHRRLPDEHTSEREWNASAHEMNGAADRRDCCDRCDRCAAETGSSFGYASSSSQS